MADTSRQVKEGGPVWCTGAARPGRGAGRAIRGRSAALARDRPAARPLPPRRYVVVRPAAGGDAAGTDGRAAVAAGCVVARLSGGRDAQYRRRAMAPSPPTIDYATRVAAGLCAGYYAAFAVDPDGYRIEAYCGRWWGCAAAYRSSAMERARDGKFADSPLERNGFELPVRVRGQSDCHPFGLRLAALGFAGRANSPPDSLLGERWSRTIGSLSRKK